MVVEAAGQLGGGLAEETELVGPFGGLLHRPDPVHRLGTGVRQQAQELALGVVELAPAREGQADRAEGLAGGDQGEHHQAALALGGQLELGVAPADLVPAGEDHLLPGADRIRSREVRPHRDLSPPRGDAGVLGAQPHHRQRLRVRQTHQRGHGGSRSVGRLGHHDLGHGLHVVRGHQLGGHAREARESGSDPLLAPGDGAARGVLEHQEDPDHRALAAQGRR